MKLHGQEQTRLCFCIKELDYIRFCLSSERMVCILLGWCCQKGPDSIRQIPQQMPQTSEQHVLNTPKAAKPRKPEPTEAVTGRKFEVKNAETEYILVSLSVRPGSQKGFTELMNLHVNRCSNSNLSSKLNFTWQLSTKTLRNSRCRFKKRWKTQLHFRLMCLCIVFINVFNVL